MKPTPEPVKLGKHEKQTVPRSDYVDELKDFPTGQKPEEKRKSNTEAEQNAEVTSKMEEEAEAIPAAPLGDPVQGDLGHQEEVHLPEDEQTLDEKLIREGKMRASEDRARHADQMRGNQQCFNNNERSAGLPKPADFLYRLGVFTKCRSRAARPGLSVAADVNPL